MENKEILKELRSIMGLNRREFAEYFCIPYRTVQEWELAHRNMPDYLLRLMLYSEKLRSENKFYSASKNVSIIRDEFGKNIVIINDIRFKGKRNIDWEEVEKYLKEYIGECYEIAESSEKIYVGKEFPDEFANAKDARGLKGANAKAKANAAQAIKELIQIAENKSEFPDYGDRHGNRAKNGWYRYDVRFGLPVYEENGTLIRYNIFSARMLVRHDADGKMYLYDILRTKKEASNPLE